MALWDVVITVDVQDRHALWRAARDQYIVEAINSGHGKPDDAAVRELLGSEYEPNVRACLIMVLDRSDHLGEGGEIEATEAQRVEDDEDDEEEA